MKFSRSQLVSIDSIVNNSNRENPRKNSEKLPGQDIHWTIELEFGLNRDLRVIVENESEVAATKSNNRVPGEHKSSKQSERKEVTREHYEKLGPIQKTDKSVRYLGHLSRSQNAISPAGLIKFGTS